MSSYYEITINNDNLSFPELNNVLGALVEITQENKNLDKEALELNFGLVGQKIVLPRGIWGLNRSLEEDMTELSTRLPDYNFKIVEAGTVMSPQFITSLDQYSMTEFEQGNLVKRYTPQPIVWVEQDNGWGW